METPNDTLSFRFYIGGYASTHTFLTMVRNRLYYSSDQYMSRQLKPLSQHADLLEVDRMALYNALVPCLAWKRRYVDNDIMDGTQWELTITVNGRRRTSIGSNEYPADFGLVISDLERIIQRPLR